MADGIPIMLIDSKRNPSIELEPLHSLAQIPEFEDWHDDLENTIRIVETSNSRIWEWEDAAHWEGIYKDALKSEMKKGWRDRISERWTLTKRTFAGLENPVILDVGCGEGQNIPLICPEVFSKSTYIAMDVSLSGLRLARLRYKPGQGLYVLASASEPPFSNNVFNAITFYGILHHTEKKSATLQNYVSKLRHGGRICVVEAIDRIRATPSWLKPLLFKATESAHEERIDYSSFVTTLNSIGKVIYFRQCYSALYGLTMRIMFIHKILSTHRCIHETFMITDDFMTRTVGKLIPFMAPALVMAILEVSKENTNNN